MNAGAGCAADQRPARRQKQAPQPGRPRWGASASKSASGRLITGPDRSGRVSRVAGVLQAGRLGRRGRRALAEQRRTYGSASASDPAANRRCGGLVEGAADAPSRRPRLPLTEKRHALNQSAMLHRHGRSTDDPPARSLPARRSHPSRCRRTIAIDGIATRGCWREEYRASSEAIIRRIVAITACAGRRWRI
jgi:hypothetical protein